MTINEIKKNPVKVGDFVKIVYGGDQHSRNLIWMVMDVIDKTSVRNIPVIKVRLMSGTWVQYGKEYLVGTERFIRMNSVKKINVVIEEQGA